MKHIFTIALVCAFSFISAQTLSPDNSILGLCPLEETTVFINNIPSTCVVDEIELESGAATIIPGQNNESFTIEPTDIVQVVGVRITFGNGSNSNCTVNPRFQNYAVLSMNEIEPSITGSLNFIAGRNNNTELQASAFYSFQGSGDPTGADTYNWSLPNTSPFTFSTRSSNQDFTDNIVDLIIDLGSEGEICVTATNSNDCPSSGSISDEACVTITRFAGQLTQILGAPPEISCNNVTPFTVSTSPAENGLTGYTYTWSVPSGWTASPTTGLTTTITPNGLNGGEISVVATAFGYQSEATTTSIGIVDFDPSTEVMGDDLVCNSPSTFTLSPAPPGGTVSWEVTPSFAVDQSSGTGSTATFSSSGSSTGNATITFTANSACGGTETFTYDFYSGFPRVTSISIDGSPGGTYNTVPVSGPTEAHYIDIDFMADSDDCVDTWAPEDIGLY